MWGLHQSLVDMSATYQQGHLSPGDENHVAPPQPRARRELFELVRGGRGVQVGDWLLFRIAMATDWKGVAVGVRHDLVQEIRSLLIHKRIEYRRHSKEACLLASMENGQERERCLVAWVAEVVAAVLSPAGGCGVSRKMGVLELLSGALDVWVPAVAQGCTKCTRARMHTGLLARRDLTQTPAGLDPRLHSPECFRAHAASAAAVPRPHALDASPCRCAVANEEVGT